MEKQKLKQYKNLIKSLLFRGEKHRKRFIGENMKNYMFEQSKFSYGDVAKLMNLRKKRFYHLLNGEYGIANEHYYIERFCEAIDIEISSFYEKLNILIGKKGVNMIKAIGEKF